MRIFLKNIGKIDNAEVDIDGITVIAGENDTGKSTVGRALFAVENSRGTCTGNRISYYCHGKTISKKNVIYLVFS